MKKIDMKDHLFDSLETHTAREIAQQPDLWLKIFEGISESKDEIEKFLKEKVGGIDRIILTGAGTSAFIGLSLKGIYQKHLKVYTEAISTTDIVSHPTDHFFSQEPTLLISFARSGNSPESIAAIELADQLSENCYHFIITCNAEGQLATYKTRNNKYVYVLPPEANDQSLAMTSSYTGMLLAGMLIAQTNRLAELKPQIAIVGDYGRKIIKDFEKQIYQVAQLPFKRVVFLGSGPQFGTAKESHLKVLELTDGKVICKYDSYLGFRHGPKAVVDNDTVMVYLFSNDPVVLKYELDLVKAMTKGNEALFEMGIMESDIGDVGLDMAFVLSKDGKQVEEELLALCNVIPAQILGLYKAVFYDLSPDKPSVSGAISRVVEGVKIYPMPN